MADTVVAVDIHRAAVVDAGSRAVVAGTALARLDLMEAAAVATVHRGSRVAAAIPAARAFRAAAVIPAAAIRAGAATMAAAGSVAGPNPTSVVTLPAGSILRMAAF